MSNTSDPVVEYTVTINCRKCGNAWNESRYIKESQMRKAVASATVSECHQCRGRGTR